MATQIAATPALYEKEAKFAWKQVNAKPTKKSVSNAKKVVASFDKLLGEKNKISIV